MIVVEGFDATGKTRIAKTIGEMLDWPVVHTGGPTKDADDVEACLARSVIRMGQRCVQDRITHISESVYDMAYRPKLAALAIARLHEIKAPTLVVYCRPKDTVVLETMQRDHVVEQWDTDEHLRRIGANVHRMLWTYDTIINVVRRNTIVIDYDRVDPESYRHVIDTVARIFDYRMERQQ